jgi:hypothetical protein
VRVSKRPAVAVVAAEIAEADRVFSAPIQLT